MAKLQAYKVLASLFLPIFLLFSSCQLPSAAYTPPDKYFINCGSDMEVNASGHRTFVGDLRSGSVSFTKERSSVMSSNLSQQHLYQTARIFRQTSFYEFQMTTNGTHLVRLHFFNSRKLSTAVFDVLASGFSLLHNLSVGNISNPPLIKEFLLTISTENFLITFIPQESSFAFINAIEVFPAPPNFIFDEVLDVNHRRSNSYYKGILSRPLQTIHRINVGGQTLTPDNDTLWRTWLPDDTYLYNPLAAKNSTPYSSKPNYQGDVNELIAPDLVYQTARETNINSSMPLPNFNITWCYHVTKNAKHLIRVHFCDIISNSPGTLLQFNLYIDSNFSQTIDPFGIVPELAAPFFKDFVVDSDDSGLLNITVGPKRSTGDSAFLNGVEIMKIMVEANSDFPAKESNQRHLFVVGLVLGGVVIVACILAGVFFVGLKRRKAERVETSHWLPLTLFGEGSSRNKNKVIERRMGSSSGPRSPASNLSLGLKITFSEIQLATNNFDCKLLIGKGGFGNVYRAKLRNGMTVAVKRSQPGSGQGLEEFQTEIMILSKIRHRHLVSLIGYCDERSEMILVYEFMEKGTLRDHLYSNSNLPRLPWNQRLEICIGAARGLNYLHKGSAGTIIHRDVKSTNILLDENYVAKVADFGLSRLGGPDITHVSTGIKGTFGYLDPEYFKTLQLTDKSDVYSFGVVLLEVLCARPVINPLLPRDQANLAEWGMFCHKKGLLEQIVDPSVKGQISPNSLKIFVESIEKCLQEDGRERPSMDDLVWDMEYALQLQQTAVHREPHEDSTVDTSTFGLALPNIQLFPSISLRSERDDMPLRNEYHSRISASQVFSQLRMDAAR